jgi:trigger factor
MNVTETTAKGLSRELKIEITKDIIHSKLMERLEELKKTIQLKGFRPGKVPITHLRKTYSNRIMPEIIEEMIRESSTKAVDDRKEKVAMQPEVIFGKGDDKDGNNEEIGLVIKGESNLIYSIKYEILPEIKSPNFSDIEVEKLVATVTKKDIDESLENIRKEQKTFSPKKSTEKAVSGDQVTIDFIGKIDDKVFEGGSATDAPLVLGSGTFIPGFEEQLIGTKVGQDVQINIKFPDDYQAKHLAGKEAVFDSVVKIIEKATETKLDDEFAKKIGFEALEKLKEAIGTQIERDFEEASKSKLKTSLLDELDKVLDFPLPINMQEAEFQNIWKSFKDDIEKSGKKFEDVVKDEVKTEKEYREISARRVRLGLLLSQIAEENKITVSDDEVNKVVLDKTREFPGQESEVLKYYQDNPNAMNQIRGPIAEDKVIAFITELVKIKEKKVTRDVLFEHDHDHGHDHDHDHSKKKSTKTKKTTKAKAVTKKASAKKEEKK